MAKQLIRIDDGQKILVSSDDSYYYKAVKEELTMSVAYKIPSELRKSLGDKASAGLIEVLSQFHSTHVKQSDHVERKIKADRIALIFKSESLHDTQIEASQARLEATITHSQTSLEAAIDQWCTSLDATMARYTTSLIRWMFVFFVGEVLAAACFLFIYYQLLIKQ